MRYMAVRTNFVSTTDHTVLILYEGSLIAVGTSLTEASYGQPFCVIDPVFANNIEALAFVPIMNGPQGEGWYGKNAHGHSFFMKPDFGEKIFASFEDAWNAGFGMMPVATVSIHANSFARTFMDDEQLAGLSINAKKELLKCALGSNAEDNLRECIGHALDILDNRDDIDKILEVSEEEKKSHEYAGPAL